MALASGIRLGPYEIHSVLGAGGMGEVYRARDTKLGRDVALKILPQGFAADPKREARFEREARILAALNHPHVAAIYGFQEADGSTSSGRRVRALVLELVEGQTLAERLACSVIPVTEALAIASQIAAAIDAAHRKGIVHRDLKPANIKITPDGQVKVLDFGLAEIERTSLASDVSQAPTITDSSTREGIVAGTAAYMSPEQTRGHAVDARTDIWAFGCVLYEMLTGRAAFARGTMSDTFAAILQLEPEWSALPRSLPPVIHRVLRRCLEKDVRVRPRHISTVDEMLRQALDPSDPKQPVFPYTRAKLKLAAVVGGIALVAIVVALLTFSVGDKTPVQLIEVSPVHRQLTFIGNVSDAAVSPDGRTFAYTSAGRLLTQEVSGGPTAEIVRADVAPQGRDISKPRWSPRGDRVAWVGYDQKGAVLQVVSGHGGRPATVTRVAPDTHYAWSPDGSRMAIAYDAGGFAIIDVEGGDFPHAVVFNGFQYPHDISWHPKLDRLAVLEKNTGERWVIWTAAPDGHDARPVYTDAQAISSICWSPVENRVYFLRPQNEAAELLVLDLDDTPAPTARVLMSGLSASGSLTISADGLSLLYVRSSETANLARLDLTRPDDEMTFITHGTRRFSSPRVSPDGRWIAAVVGGPPRTRIVKLPFDGGELIPLTSGDHFDGAPAWSPDGTSIAFASVRAGTSGVWLMTADGKQLEQLHDAAPNVNLRTAWTPDGKLMWQETTSMGQMNYRIRDLTSGHDSFLISRTTYGWVFSPEFAPSGNELAVFWNRDRREGPRGLYVLSWPALVPRLVTPVPYWPIGWAADGAAVVAVNETTGLWLISTRDGQANSLARVPLPGDDEAGADVTHDGRYLVSTVVASTADVWLIERFEPQARTRH